jgi:hypothetical protein
MPVQRHLRTLVGTLVIGTLLLGGMSAAQESTPTPDPLLPPP